MEEPVWIETDFVEKIHDLIVEQIGGSLGIRDHNMLESALSKPQNQFFYSENPDIFDIAAAYAHGISRNHAFIDGNKRTAFVVAGIFLEKNGFELDPEKTLALEESIVSLAQDEISQEEFADALRSVSSPVSRPTLVVPGLHLEEEPPCQCCHQFDKALYLAVCELIEQRDADSETDLTREGVDDGMELTS